jgi:hypothetical protein
LRQIAGSITDNVLPGVGQTVGSLVVAGAVLGLAFLFGVTTCLTGESNPGQTSGQSQPSNAREGESGVDAAGIIPPNLVSPDTNDMPSVPTYKLYAVRSDGVSLYHTPDGAATAREFLRKDEAVMVLSSKAFQDGTLMYEIRTLVSQAQGWVNKADIVPVLGREGMQVLIH